MSGPRVAIVTGGGSGIGLAISQRLAADGCAVAVLDLHAESATAAAQAIVETGGKSIGLRADVGDRQQVLAAVDEVRRRLGAAAILVNNAGTGATFTRFLKITPEDGSERAGEPTGVFHCCQAVLPDMIDAGWGRIVNISSSSAHSGQPLLAPTCPPNRGSTASPSPSPSSSAPRGITVNAIPPGFIDTPMLRASEGRGELRRRGRCRCHRPHAGAAGRPARGRRGHLLVPVPRRGRLHHRPDHRGQRGPQYLTAVRRTSAGRRRARRRRFAAPWRARRKRPTVNTDVHHLLRVELPGEHGIGGVGRCGHRPPVRRRPRARPSRAATQPAASGPTRTRATSSGLIPSHAGHGRRAAPIRTWRLAGGRPAGSATPV